MTTKCTKNTKKFINKLNEFRTTRKAWKENGLNMKRAIIIVTNSFNWFNSVIVYVPNRVETCHGASH